MHDPLTVAHEVKIPLFYKRENTLYRDNRKEWQFYHLATIWHKDPERGPGGDDSCGWLKRAHHGDQAVLARIIKRFDEDWDRVFRTSKEDHDSDDGKFVERVYYCGYFMPEDSGAGMPNMSVSGIVLNLFFMAVGEHFESAGATNWKKARRWMQRNLFDILLLAENPTDSLRDSIVRKWGCDTRRKDRIQNIAATIYGWILRREQRWWQHPRWHVHHWRLQLHFWQAFHRWAFVRCAKCGGRFRYHEPVCGGWTGNAIWHERCQDNKVDTSAN